MPFAIRSASLRWPKTDKLAGACRAAEKRAMNTRFNATSGLMAQPRGATLHVVGGRP